MTNNLLVSPDDFKKINTAMLRLLLALYETPGNALSTVKLFNTADMSTAYGGKIIRKAENEGYIVRLRVPKPRGEQGNDMVVNTLTLKGKKLLKKLQLA
jgi:hypothetical protein